MSETLCIKNFGPLKDVRLNLKKFNIIIGKNATGKSTIAKVLAVCRYFSYIINNGSISQPFAAGLDSWGLSESIQDNTYIHYECKHYSFEAKRTASKVYEPNPESGDIIGGIDSPIFTCSCIPLSNEFKGLLAEFDKIKPGHGSAYSYVDDGTWRIPTSFFQNDVADVLDNPFYLPTERGLQSIFSLGKTTISNISDSLFSQLAKLDSCARAFRQEIAIEHLNISYKNDDGRGQIKKHTDKEFLSLNNGASGYKSSIPIILVEKYYREKENRARTFLIEEPELNLFPDAQQSLIEYLVDKTVNYGHSMLLTTHSPYILTSLNNLLYAYVIGQSHKTEVKKFIEQKYWINPSEVSAYIITDGCQENIIDKEGLIKAEKIDMVSATLNANFNAVMDIELSINK